MSVLESLLVGVFGMAVVFVVLVGLNLLIKLQASLISRFSKKPAPTFVQERPAEDELYIPELAAEEEVPENDIDVVVSPGPGTVLDVNVAVGASVKRGELLLLLDAMDMEYEIDATKSGTIIGILVKKGEFVSIGTPLVEIQ